MAKAEACCGHISDAQAGGYCDDCPAVAPLNKTTWNDAGGGV